MSKTKEELNKLKEEVETLADKNDIKAKKILADGPPQTAKTRQNITLT